MLRATLDIWYCGLSSMDVSTSAAQSLPLPPRLP